MKLSFESAKLLSLGTPAIPVFSLRITEHPMPTGSRDTGVLLDWILRSMGMVRRTTEEEEGALHRILMEAFLLDPLRGWDSKQLGDRTGLSNTGIHHQMVKLRECGLVTAQLDGKWHRYVLRGGSMSAATAIIESQASAILKLRLSELSESVEQSDTRMEVDAEDEEDNFSIKITEPGPLGDMEPQSALLIDLGLEGETKRASDGLARGVFHELCSSHHPITLLALSERLSETRGRVSTAVNRMRSASIVERAPMVERLPQDIYSGLARQYDARGEDWLLSRGGLGRLDPGASQTLVSGVTDGSLDIASVREALLQTPLDSQRILLNTLGGRMPYGFRIAGADGKAVSSRVMIGASRTLRRIRTVAERLDAIV